MALPIGPFPFTLTDGTLADANQVMANFNTLLNGVNGLAPLGVPTVGSTLNVKASLPTAGTSVTFTADNVTVATALNGTSYTLANYSQSLNTATTGAGGMDTGTTPTSSYVAVYAIYNPTAPSISILGTNAATSAPTVYGGANMPAGYTASALIGIWPTNATPALAAGYIRNRTFQYQSFINSLNGSTTARASLTSLSIAGAVPPSAINVSALITLVTNGSFAGGTVATQIASDSVAQVYAVSGFVPASTATSFVGAIPPVMLPTAQTIWYLTAGVGTNCSITISINSYSW
jgi:hypothetical protein